MRFVSHELSVEVHVGNPRVWEAEAKDHGLKAILGYTVRLYLQKKKEFFPKILQHLQFCFPFFQQA